MKIIDTSTFVGIFNEAKRPDVFEDLLQLGHILVITKYVLSEVEDPTTSTNVKRLITERKLERSERNALEEIKAFQLSYTNLEPGETDVILTYLKLSQYTDNIYCILDDDAARKTASKLKIRYTGLIGLLKMLKTRGIKSPDEIREIFKLLKKGGFRMPKHIDI